MGLGLDLSCTYIRERKKRGKSNEAAIPGTSNSFSLMTAQQVVQGRAGSETPADKVEATI